MGLAQDTVTQLVNGQPGDAGGQLATPSSFPGKETQGPMALNPATCLVFLICKIERVTVPPLQGYRGKEVGASVNNEDGPCLAHGHCSN